MFLDLGEIEEIVRLAANWRDIFQPLLQRLFKNQTRFSVHFQEIVDYRNTLMHGGRQLEPHQRELLTIYLSEMRKGFRLPTGG